MFFTIAPTPDTRLPNHHAIGDEWFSHDNGWVQQGASWYKGYNHDNINHGNFARITLTDQGIQVEHDQYRGFPLWWDSETGVLTNLMGSGASLWADDVVVYTTQGITTAKRDVIGPVDTSPLSLASLIDDLCQNFVQKFEALDRDYPLIPRKLFVTGGVDTVLLLAVARHAGVKVDVLQHEFFYYDKFANSNIEQLKQQHWAYAQMHHWPNSTVLLSGSCGDEFMFRGPYLIALWSAWHGIDIVKHLTDHTGYHCGYFLKDKNRKIFDNFYHRQDNVREQYSSKRDLTWQLLNANLNDHQHWHLGETLTWTPFKDLDITKKILRLDQEDLLRHIVDATINKEMIKRLYPDALQLISDTKNSNHRQYLDLLGTI
jgi:hypothetical protein